MYGIFRESLVMLQNYYGRVTWFALYAAAFVFLFVREKDRMRRCLLLYAPLVTMVLFLFPLTRKVYVALMDEGATYYRVLWLIPSGVTVAFAAVTLFAAHRRAALVSGCALCALCGSLVYKSVHITPAQNLYHLPQTVIDLCDRMPPDEETGKTYAAFPSELVHFVRQYDTRFIMPFGREMVEPVWDHWNLIYTAMEEAEVIDMEHLTTLLREEGYDHLVLRAGRKTDGTPADFGFEKIGETDGYEIYADREGRLP